MISLLDHSVFFLIGRMLSQSTSGWMTPQHHGPDKPGLGPQQRCVHLGLAETFVRAFLTSIAVDNFELP